MNSFSVQVQVFKKHRGGNFWTRITFHSQYLQLLMRMIVIYL